MVTLAASSPVFNPQAGRKKTTVTQQRINELSKSPDEFALSFLVSGLSTAPEGLAAVVPPKNALHPAMTKSQSLLSEFIIKVNVFAYLMPGGIISFCLPVAFAWKEVKAGTEKKEKLPLRFGP